MTDFEQARMTMVDTQIRPNDVTDHRILSAFQSVPREEFVSAAQKPLAYIDEDLPVTSTESSRYLMEAMTLSKLIQLASIDEDSIVLDVGCATGYSTAVISQICNSVVALECDPELVESASQTLTELGYDNAVVVGGALRDGYKKEGPYDVIFVGGAILCAPEELCQQLKVGGRLVVVEGTGNAAIAKLYSKESSGICSRIAFNCAVKPLPGFEKEIGFNF